MPEAIRKVNIIGHLHPDTDSICSAISYAYLKNTVGKTNIYEPRRAGTINRETAFVLKHFGFDEPQLITSVMPQVKDTEIQRQAGIDSEMSLFAAWNLMRETKVDTLCVTDPQNNLEGLIAVKDIANANMDVFDTSIVADSHTSYANIVSTLNGEMILGNPADTVHAGDVRVGTTPEMMEDTVKAGDIVLVTNRYETQQFAVECDASCLIICCSAHVSDRVVASARRHGCSIITTPYDTYAAARLISMSIPVRAKMLAENILKVSVNTSIDDARKMMAKSRHRFFPIIDENGTYAGLISSSSLLTAKKKHVILVDHNERTQAVEGLEQAEIMEIIDHHRIGSIETSGPALFRNMPVGCTCTILYLIYQENDVEIPPSIAGLMLSAILSDTLAFRSPTCTPVDQKAGKALAKICGEDIPSYADAMFEAGADLTGRTAEEVFHQDFKIFSRGNVKFGVGQGSFMTENSRKAAEALVGPYLPEAAQAEELPLVFYLFTDVKTSSSEVLWYGEDADGIVSRAFDVEPEDGLAKLPGVVSRKKQVIPALMATLQSIQEDQD
ncbi:putative manganese-dependent inorganic diphosphatase [Thermophilibacter immobilis]|uniref:inorganic diphosphatase n=1 Tax=Thermophilibacter immobilis TaxID=2779519 RepID=A0A7S7M7V5_9ACTN|nr:putative manganese-dependent inorganic diphosphatase [Thermophilibacter immobilis]QOY60385.1 putative manganese-dependent inorganic diphosphatase [Thermophilibacter immobilis]